MPHRRVTFSKFIIEDRRRAGVEGAALAALLNDVQTACKFIDVAVARGALGTTTRTDPAAAPARSLEAVANDIMLATCEWGGQLCGMSSGEMASLYAIPPAYPRGRYLLVFSPLDGAANSDINMTLGTVFSVLKAPEGVTEPSVEYYLQAGTRQVAAGYALYGPVSMMVATLGAGVHGFTLDREIGAYTLTHPSMRVPEQTREFAINASNERFWEPPVRRYVEECVEGRSGPRGVDYSMRWIACPIADVHRILIRGGLFILPRDTRDSSKAGHLRLLHAANPMAMLMEQAGGGASTGRGRILDVVPSSIAQDVPVILGSRFEVDRLVRYHATYDSGEEVKFETPLFNTRSLFRTA